MKKGKILIISIALLATLIAMGLSLNAFAAPATSAKGLTISLSGNSLAPFSIIKINGKSFDSASSTSVIFTTNSGKVFTVPALAVSSKAIEVIIPPVNFSENEGLFIGENVSVKVIQIKTVGNKTTIKTSNELTGISIARQGRPNVSSLPTGALTVSFLIAARESLSAIENKIPNGVDEMSLIASEFEIDQLDATISAFTKDPNLPMEISTETGFITIDESDIEKLDALYMGYLSELEKRNLISSDSNSLFSFVPVARAEEINECMKRALGEGYGDTQLQNILNEPCQFREAKAKNAEKVGALLPEAAKFVYSFPIMTTSVMLGAGAQAAGLAKATQIALSAGYSFATETLLEGKAKVSNGLTSIAKAVVDHKLGVPALEIGIPSAKLFYEVSKALSKSKTPTPAVVSAPDTTPPAVKFITTTGAGTNVTTTSTQLTIPGASQSTTTNKTPTKSPAKKPVVPTPQAPAPNPNSIPVITPTKDFNYSISINLTASEHTECGPDCIGYTSDASATTTITLDNLFIPSSSAGASGSTNAPFSYTCSSTASGGKSGSVNDILNGYAFGISLVNENQGVTLHYQGEPNYAYFENTCGGTAQDPIWLIKKALAKSIGGEGPLLKHVYNINGETAPFSGRDHDAAISNDVSYFEWAGTVTLTPK